MNATVGFFKGCPQGRPSVDSGLGVGGWWWNGCKFTEASRNLFMVQNISSGLSRSFLDQLDDAHLQGVGYFLALIKHNPNSPRHLNKAFHALAGLKEGLKESSVPDYADPYVAAAYMVSYHLQHCVLAYWSFKTLFKRAGIPDSLYVCDVGAGTGAGRVGLALALDEQHKSPMVHFDACEPAEAMLSAGSAFWRSLLVPLASHVPDNQYREFSSLPDEVPSVPEGTWRTVTAFHLALPYNSEIQRATANDFGSRRIIQQALNVVSPDVGMFTCHKDKDGPLRQATHGLPQWSTSYNIDITIPTDSSGDAEPSRFYTDFAVPWGFEVSEGASVSRWSRYRFSLPAGILLLRTSPSISETSLGERARLSGSRARVIGLEAGATETGKSSQESLDEMPPPPNVRRVRSRQINVRLNDDEYQLLKEAADAEELTVNSYIRQVSLDAAAPEPRFVEKPSQLREIERPTDNPSTPGTQPMAQPTTFSVGDRVSAGIMGLGVVQEIRKNKAVVLINGRIPCEVAITELSPT